MASIKILNQFKSYDLSRPDVLFGISKATHRFFMIGDNIVSGIISDANAERILAAGADIVMGISNPNFIRHEYVFNIQSNIFIELPGWMSYLASENWTSTYGTWNGANWDSEWDGEMSVIDLYPALTWADDFRPSNCRIIFSGQDSIYLRIRGSDGPSLFSGNISSPAKVDLVYKEKLADATFDILAIKGGSGAKAYSYYGFTDEIRSNFSVTTGEATIAIGENREIITGDRQDGKVRKYDSVGNLLDTLTMARYVWGVAWDGTNLFTMESTDRNPNFNNLHIVRYNGWSNSINLSLDIGPVFSWARTIAVNPINGNVVICGNTDSQYWNPGNNRIREYVGFSTSLAQPVIDHSAVDAVADSIGIAFTQTGNLVVAAFSTRCVEYDGMDINTEVSYMTGKWAGEEQYMGRNAIAITGPLTPVYPWSFDISQIYLTGSYGQNIDFNITAIDFNLPDPIFVSYSPINIFLFHASGDDDSQAITLDGQLAPGVQSDFATDGLSYCYRSAMLDNGKVVVAGYDGNGPVMVNCYAEGSTTDISWSYTIIGSAYGYSSECCILNNGNIVVFWPDYNSDRPSFVILDPNGGLIQDITDADPSVSYDVNSDEPVHVLALADGGFYCYWMEDDTYPAGSVWNENGIQRVDHDYYEDDIEPSAPIQMPTGGGGIYAGWFVISDSYGNNSLTVVDPTNMANTVRDIATGGIEGYPEWVYMASPPAWTDRIVVIWNHGSVIKYMIVDDEGNTIDGSHELFTGIIYDLIQLPDGNLLMPYFDTGSEYGQSFYILDTSINTEITIKSGPHTGFTGLTTNPSRACHGCVASAD
jgi:hypothetical protein